MVEEVEKDERLLNETITATADIDVYVLFEQLTGVRPSTIRTKATRERYEKSIEKYNIQSNPYFSRMWTPQNTDKISYYTFSATYNTQDFTTAEAFTLVSKFIDNPVIKAPSSVKFLPESLRKLAFIDFITKKRIIYTVEKNGKERRLINDEIFREYFFPKKDCLQTKILVEAENIQKTLKPLKRSMFL